MFLGLDCFGLDELNKNTGLTAGLAMTKTRRVEKNYKSSESSSLRGLPGDI